MEFPVIKQEYINASELFQDMEMGVVFAWHIDGSMFRSFPDTLCRPMHRPIAFADSSGGGNQDVLTQALPVIKSGYNTKR